MLGRGTEDRRRRAGWALEALFLSTFVATAKAQGAECPQPSFGGNVVLSNDDILKNSFPDGSSAAFSCAVGYVRTGGLTTVTCNNGAWSELTLQCTKKSCGPPGELHNGHFDLSEGIDFGARIVASCNKGFMIVGPNYLECLDSGWSTRLPTCEVVKCPEPSLIQNGEIVIKPNKEFPEYNDVIEYNCKSGYTLIGKSQIVCGDNGKYDFDPPKCEVISCPVPQIPNAIRIQGNPPYGYKSLAVYECNSGYVMKGSPKIVCELNGWSPAVPSCIHGTSTTTTTTTTTTASNGGDKDSKSNYAALIAGVCVAAVLLIFLCFGVCYCYRKKKGDYHTREEDQKRTEGLL
ncbi:membrane cofactor protein-like isoform X2 [Scleropages formosus]|uniref:membrane cofactor protein-like isoform X2 n=1 Tax=Scleropages formosus TaxID=113540 RepID=UPI0008780663|nr:membrane cofactor protein-like isoform X2 [Scleropages formosus]